MGMGSIMGWGSDGMAGEMDNWLGTDRGQVARGGGGRDSGTGEANNKGIKM